MQKFFDGIINGFSEEAGQYLWLLAVSIAALVYKRFSRLKVFAKIALLLLLGVIILYVGCEAYTFLKHRESPSEFVREEPLITPEQEYSQEVLDLMESIKRWNDPEAMYQLGRAYQFGLCGLAKNYTEAVMWFRRSAQQGSSYGQYNLGFMYEHGYGVKQNISTAAKYYQLSAAQGHQEAKTALERLNFLQYINKE